MAQFINLTPHQINIHGTEGEVLSVPASGNVARVATESFIVHTTDGVDFFKTETGEVEGLPEFDREVFLIVSGQVRSALPRRTDLVSPGTLVRDKDGRPIGCMGLNCNF